MEKILTLITVFLLIMGGLFAQQSKVWDYPIKPGTKEWGNLKSYQERLNAYNIPDNILKTISTEQLAKTCLDYPEFRLVFTRNDLQSGYNHIYKIFNGFSELESRTDAGKELLKIYKSYKPEGFGKNSTLLEIGEHIVRFTYIELLMAQYNILNSLSSNEMAELRIECIKKYKEKKNQQTHYGIIGLQTTALILARINKEYLSKTVAKFGENKFTSFLNYVIVFEPEMLDEIITECEKISSK